MNTAPQSWPSRPISAGRDVIERTYPPGRFVGRDWLIAEAERFRHDSQQRRLVIVGKPGTGKSALLAYLANSWNAPCHFVRTGNKVGVTGVSARAFLASLGLQLFELFGPELFPMPTERRTSVTVGLASGKSEVIGRVIDTLVTLDFGPRPAQAVSVRVGAARGGSTVVGERIRRVVDVTMALEPADLLHVMLVNPLLELYRRDPDIRVPVLIDALDESRDHPGPGILDVLPVPADDAYPPNLKLLMTSRDTGLETFEETELLRLDDIGHAALSRQDARTYLQARLGEPPLAAAAALAPLESMRLIENLHERSEGNFLYLFHVLNEIEKAVAVDPAALSSVPVPQGLDDVYRVFALTKIQRDTGREEWTTWYEPVLGILAVAREAIDTGTLATLAGVDESNARFIVGTIRQFLDEADLGKFRIYHRDFAEYLLDRNRNRDYPLRPERFHQTVAAAFIPAADGTAARLGLTGADGYAIRHLTAHLRLASLVPELHRLLALTDTTMRNAWFAAKSAAGDLAGFMSDVEAARGMLRDHVGERDEQIIRAEATYALMMSSIRSLTALVPAPMVKALLREGIWSPEAALGFAANGADAESRAKTAIALLEAGPQWSWAEARQITIRSLISMSRPRESVIADYAAALTQLPADSPQRSEESIIEDLDAIVPPAVEDREAAVTLAAFAPLLSDRALSRAETLASTLRSPLRRAYANATLAARGGRSAIADLDQALAVAFEEAGNLGRSEAIGSFLQAGGDPAWAATQVNETLLLADANEQFRWRIYANVIHLSSPPDLTLRLRHLLGNDGIFSFNSGSKLPDLTRRLAGPIASLLLDPAVLATLEDSLTHFRWLLMAIRVAPSLPETQRPALVDQIIDILQPGDLDGSLSRILANLGPLPPHQLDRALSLAQALQPLRKTDALGGLGACAPPPRRAVIAAQALDLIADFNPGTESAETLGRLAPVLDKAGLRRAVRIVETIGDKQASTDHLSTLIPYLRDGYKERAMRRAIELIGTYEARDGSDVGSIYGARFLGAMAPDLPRSLTGDAATAARSLSEPVWRALALAALAPAFAPEDQPAVLAEARHNLPDDATPSSRAEVLAAFAAAQGTEREQFVNAAIAEIEQTKSFRDTADAIQAVRPVLSDVQLAATVQRCIGRTDRSEQAQKIVARFARTLPMSFIEQSLSLFEDILPENRYLLVPLLVRLVGAGQEDRARRLAKQQGLQAETALPILGVEEAIDLLADHPTDSMKVSIATRMAELGNTQAARAVLNQLSEPDAALALSCRLAVLASQRRDHREVLQLWQRCLDRTAALKRVNTFEAINKLAPVAAAIAGRDGPNGLLDAVEQALAWWP